jgi:hypothetical protein
MLTEDSLRIRYEKLSQSNSLWCHGNAKDLRNGKITMTNHLKMKKLRNKMSKSIDLTKEYSHGLVHAQTVMVRRDFHFKLGLYDETLRFSSDNEMFRRAIRFKEIPLHVDEFVSIYRHHSSQMSRSKYKIERNTKIRKQLIKKVEKRFSDGINQINTRLLME